ncbi:MAG: glycosyltransferase [Muribaculaceae bacterium]|nr:glycosyltransferase [Muribaculaceae bacterium]
MEKPKISIIVPIYNMETYLRQCLDSIKDQTFNDWECILVDDGSTDSSSEICDEYASKDPRFKVIHKYNGGVSSARNAGMAAAVAEYVGFVDPDDWTEPMLFDRLYHLITEYDADIVQVGYIKEFLGHNSTKHLVNNTIVIDGDEAVREISFDKIPNYLWNKLHRRSIMTCMFPEGRSFEDIYVYGHWLLNVKKMVLDPAPLYHYRMRKGSIVHSYNPLERYDYFLSCIDVMNRVEKLLTGKNDINRKNAYINKSAVGAAKSIARNIKKINQRDETIKKISIEVSNYPLPSPRFMGLKPWFRAKLLRKNPKFFGFLMRLVFRADIMMKRRAKQYFD